MRWSLVVAGPIPGDLTPIRTAAHSTRDPVIATADALAELLADPATSGLALIGSDADLALVVTEMHSAARDVPIALVPRRDSDLLRMFGLTRATIVPRLQSGRPYRVDLGRVRTTSGVTPFVSHVAALPAGRGRRLRRSAEVSVSTPRHTHRQSSWWVVAANAQHLSSRTIAPRSSVEDGSLDVQLFGGSAQQRRRILRLARRGLHLQHPEVWRRRTAVASVATPSHWQVRVDGIPIDSGPFEVAIEPAAFDLWI